MSNRKFMTENARITDAYAQMYAKRGVSESSKNEGHSLLKSLRGALPIDGRGSDKTGRRLGVRKVLPFEKRDARNCCGHSVPLKKNRQFQKITNDCRSKGGIELSAGLKDKLGTRKILPFEKRDERPTSIGRIGNVKNVSAVKGVRESADDFEEIKDVETVSCEDCSKRDEVLELVLSTFEQIYDNLSDDDKETVDEVKAEIESVLNPEEDEDDADDSDDFDDEIGESFINEAKRRSGRKSPRVKGSKGGKGKIETRQERIDRLRREAGETNGKKPGEETGKKPGEETVERPGEETGKKPGENTGETGLEGGGNSAWKSIDDLPRQPGELDANYNVRNAAHKATTLAARNKISLTAALATLGIGAFLTKQVMDFLGLGGGDEDGKTEKPETPEGSVAPVAPSNDSKYDQKERALSDAQGAAAKAQGEDEDHIRRFNVDQYGLPLDPDMRRKAEALLAREAELRRGANGTGGEGGGSDRGVLVHLGELPGRLLGGVGDAVGRIGTGIGTGVGGLITGVTDGVEHVVTAPTRIYRDSARNIRGADYGIDAGSADREYDLRIKREDERERMKMQREEEQARREAEQRSSGNGGSTQQEGSAAPQSQTYTVKDNQGGENKVVQTPDSVTVTSPGWKEEPEGEAK